MSDECSTKTQGERIQLNEFCSFDWDYHSVSRPFQIYQSYEHAQTEVEKLRQELYPNLFAANDDATDASKLETIAEDVTDLTDAYNDFTEDTSEAHGSGSDDEVRGRMDDGEENISRSDDEDDDEPVSYNSINS